MRILLVNQYAGGPELGMEHRPYWMAREWQAAGHQVLVVAGEHSHLRPTLPRGIVDVGGVTYRVIPTLSYEHNGIKRFLNIMSFHAQLRRKRRELADWRPDVVIASSTHPLDVRPAAAIARSAGASFVYEVHDLWPLSPMLLNDMSPSHPMIRLMQREEDFGYRNADLVVSLLPRTEAYMREHGLPPGRWMWVPNGVDLIAAAQSTVESDEGEAAVTRLREIRQDWPFLMIYAGSHGEANALGALLSLADETAGMGVALVLLGRGPLKSALQDEYGSAPNVFFLESVPRHEVGACLALADAAYIGLLPSPLWAHGVSPNKSYDYMAAGIPQLEAIGAANSPVREAECGVSVSSADPDAILSGIKQMVASSPQQRRTWGENAKTYVTTHMAEDLLARRMLEAMADLRGAASDGRDPVPRRS